MRFVVRRAEMLATSPKGVTNRDAWKASARNGNQDAIRKLQWPRYPETLGYLDDWHTELSMGRGESPHGIAPITWLDVESWARQTRRAVAPQEASALVQLDRAFVAALRGTHEPKAETTPATDDGVTPTAVVPAWPTRTEP